VLNQPGSPQSYAKQLGDDPIVHSHLSALYDTLLEQNLIRWVLPAWLAPT
jgi:26S proteasome regulatory subunit N6